MRLTGHSKKNSPQPLVLSLIMYVYNNNDGEMGVVVGNNGKVEDIYGYTSDVSWCSSDFVYFVVISVV